MKELFFMGGAFFMSILTILFVAMAGWMIYQMVLISSPRNVSKEDVRNKLSIGRSIGLFALITGILGQLIGFYSAFSALEVVDNISPKILFGGIKVSMIPTLYGMIIYLISLLLWFSGNFMNNKTQGK